MVIKTAVRQRRPTSPRPRLNPYGTGYQIAKQVSKSWGFYQDIKQYDPGYYVEKYTYKPRKRIAGYLGQKLHSKARNGANYYKYKKRTRYYGINWNYNSGCIGRKSSDLPCSNYSQ